MRRDISGGSDTSGPQHVPDSFMFPYSNAWSFTWDRNIQPGSRDISVSAVERFVRYLGFHLNTSTQDISGHLDRWHVTTPACCIYLQNNKVESTMNRINDVNSQKTQVKVKLTWNDEMIESLINIIKEYKLS